MTANPSSTIGTAHHRWRRDGARTGAGGAGTISLAVSLTDVTTASAWIAALAIVALIATGWRKPARATVPVPRARNGAHRRVPVEVEPIAVRPYRRTPLWRRIWAVVAASTLTAVTGAVLAIALSAAVAYVVITLTDMLGS